MKRWLALILLLAGTCLADDGLPLNQSFSVPVVVSGKSTTGTAFITSDRVMRIFYVQDGKIAGPILYTLQRGDSPAPAPVPVPAPTPIPTPTPEPAPRPAGPLSVMVVYDTNSLDNMTASQAAIFTSKAVRDYLDSKCSRDDVVADGRPAKLPAWRFLSPTADVKAMPERAQKWHAELKARKLPSVKIGNGATEYIGDLPDSPAAFLALLKKYGN